MTYDLTPRADRIRALRTQIRRLEKELTNLIKATHTPDPTEPTTPHCGTNRGYKRHHYQGETACDPCKAAHNIHERSEKARRKLAKAS